MITMVLMIIINSFDGVINWEEVYDALTKINYQGHLVTETSLPWITSKKVKSFGLNKSCGQN